MVADRYERRGDERLSESDRNGEMDTICQDALRKQSDANESTYTVACP